MFLIVITSIFFNWSLAILTSKRISSSWKIWTYLSLRYVNKLWKRRQKTVKILVKLPRVNKSGFLGLGSLKRLLRKHFIQKNLQESLFCNWIEDSYLCLLSSRLNATLRCEVIALTLWSIMSNFSNHRRLDLHDE